MLKIKVNPSVKYDLLAFRREMRRGGIDNWALIQDAYRELKSMLRAIGDDLESCKFVRQVGPEFFEYTLRPNKIFVLLLREREGRDVTIEIYSWSTAPYLESP